MLKKTIQITFSNGNIHYIYNALGTKQKKIVTAGTDTTTTDYAGNYIYQNNVLQMISQPEGYIEPNAQNGFDYIYQYKDHLGNIRLTYKDDELYDTDFNDGSYSPWQASVNTTSMTIEDDRLKVVTGVHLNGANGYYDLLAGETYEISVDVDRSLFTTDLEFSLWKGNSKIYGEYVTTSKTVTYAYTPSETDTYRINFRLRDYGYDGADQTFYLDNVIIRDTVLALIEENNYYPFGLKHEGYNTTVSSNTNAVATKFKYNGKELQDDLIGSSSLGLYDYGARFYDAAIGRWHCIDPQAERYSFMSPYAYVANNPMLLIDPNGEEIWIHYEDADGNVQKMQYTQGMTYEGDNGFVTSAVTALNQMNSTEIGAEVLVSLSSSENTFDLKNEVPTDKDGNKIDNALSFQANKDGGGTIRAGALMNENMQEGQKLESTAHELYHGYQRENGQTGTVNNEIGAYLYGRAVNYTYQMNSGGGFGEMPWGNGTVSGNAYGEAMSGLMWGTTFNYGQYSTAVNNFKTGSSVNTTRSGGQGLYKSFSIKPASQNPLIKKFFPLVR